MHKDFFFIQVDYSRENNFSETINGNFWGKLVEASHGKSRSGFSGMLEQSVGLFLRIPIKKTHTHDIVACDIFVVFAKLANSNSCPFSAERYSAP